MRVSFRQNLLPEKERFAVKRKRFSVEQIVAVLKQAEVGCAGGGSSVGGLRAFSVLFSTRWASV
jgi:hypothetical protein